MSSITPIRQVGASGAGTGASNAPQVITNSGPALAIGSLVLVRIASRGATVTYGVSDSAGNTWTQVTTNPVQSNVETGLYWSILTTSIPTSGTITITRGGTVTMVCTADAFSGVAASSPTEVPNNAVSGAVSMSVTTNGATTNTEDLLVATGAQQGNTTDTQASGWSNFSAGISLQGGTGSTTFVKNQGGWRTPGTTGTFTWAPTTSTNSWSAKIVAFKPAVSATAFSGFGIPL